MKIKKMTFEEWDKEMDKITQKKYKKDLKKSKGLIPNNYFERLNQLLIAWDTTETNKALVKATWVLAIATIILIISTIIFSTLTYSQIENLVNASERTANSSRITAEAAMDIRETVEGIAEGEEATEARELEAKNLIWLWILIAVVVGIILIGCGIIGPRKKK